MSNISIHTYQFNADEMSVQVIEWHEDGCETYLVDEASVSTPELLQEILAPYVGCQRIHRAPGIRQVSTHQ